MDRKAALARAREQVGDEPPAQWRAWRLQRVGWWLMGGLVALAASGAIGAEGPLGRREAASADDTLRAVYEPVVRRSRPAAWSVEMPAGATTLLLQDPTLEGFLPRLVVPRAQSERRLPDGLELVFAAPAPERVLLVMEPRGPGLHSLRLSAGGAALALNVLALP